MSAESTIIELQVRVWDGDNWPEKRVSIGCPFSGLAVMISPRYTGMEIAEADATHIVRCVNYHKRLVESVDNLIKIMDGEDGTHSAMRARRLLAELEKKE